MSWWSSSWLPSLPSIDFSLPSSIQRRFISFVLKRSLGHFLKPGQLDVQQIESQIGSGYVQVRDIELDNDAINALIAGLPIELHDGSVGKVTARIPWPNPLTSTVGLSLESLHLTFYLLPTTAESPRSHVANLADSVMSAAETFIHEELTPGEEASFRSSYNHDLAESIPDYLPGGLDPFLRDDETAHEDAEPPGVSVFATLIEKLLARFEFDASDTKITLVHPLHSSFSIVLSNICYRTQGNGDVSAETDTDSIPPSSPPAAKSNQEIRTVTLSGFTVTTRCLRPQREQQSNFFPQYLSHAPASPQLHSPPAPPSPYSDSSDMDEDAQLLLSQSMVFPHPSMSMNSSIGGSIYHSAISSAIAPFPEESPASPEFEPRIATPTLEDRSGGEITPPSSNREPLFQRSLSGQRGEVEDETIFSLSSEPIVISLITPPLLQKPSHIASPASSSLASSNPLESSSPSEPSNHQEERRTHHDKVRLTVSIGVIACALRARHIHSFIRIARLWGMHRPLEPPQPKPSSIPASGGLTPVTSIYDVFTSNVDIRGMVMLLLPASTDQDSRSNDALSDFFSHPLTPPRLHHGYVRLHLDNLSGSFVMDPILGSDPAAKRKGLTRTASRSFDTTATFKIGDISAFAFLLPLHRGRGEEAPGLPLEPRALPLLITDPHLSKQYSLQHGPIKSPDTDPQKGLLPEFDIIDWTDATLQSSSARPSLWRTKLPQTHTSRHSKSHFQDSNLDILNLSHGSPRGKTHDLPSPFSSPSQRDPILLSASPTPSGIDGPSTSPGKSSDLLRQHDTSALALKLRMVLSPDSRSSHSDKHDLSRLDVNLVPLHIFVDLGLIFGKRGDSEMLRFLEEVSASEEEKLADTETKEAEEGGLSDSSLEHEDDSLPVQVSDVPDSKERERERRRLERLLLEDLDLQFDYRERPKENTRSSPSTRSKRKERAKSKPISVSVKLPMLRVEARTPSPTSHIPRSGAIVVDVHDIQVLPGRSPEQRKREGGVQFSRSNEPPAESFAENVLGSITWQDIVIAHCPLGHKKASMIATIGALSVDDSVQSADTEGQFGISSFEKTPVPPVKPHILVTHSRRSPSSSLSQSHSATLAVIVVVPNVNVELTKPNFDGLQLWADDLSRLLEDVSQAPLSSDSDTERAESRNASLIGSRYFSQPRRNLSLNESKPGSINLRQSQHPASETVVKLTIAKASIRLIVPRLVETSPLVRTLTISASEIDLLAELKPEGREETVLTVDVGDVRIGAVSKAGSAISFMHSTKPNNLIPTSHPVIKLRIVSLTLPETTLKESKIRLTVSGMTLNVHPELDWVHELASFGKAPPGAFESVVPSERTQIFVKIINTSIQVLAPSYPGAVVPYIQELELSTVLSGSSSGFSLQLSVPLFTLWLIDDIGISNTLGATDDVRSTTSPHDLIWKDLGYALVAELTKLDLKVTQDSGSTLQDIRVSINHADLRLHLCADTMTAFASFMSDFGSLFNSPAELDMSSRKPRNEPENLSSIPRSPWGLLSSIDEHAFRQLPEVGSAPDMIQDDLPNNPEYLDDSFSASAGLRELDDDDLDDFSVESAEGNSPSASKIHGHTSRYGGETIKMFSKDGLRTVQNYFETLPPESTDESSSYGQSSICVRAHSCDITLLLYDGYDWVRTQKIIEEQAKEMRRKLAKIKQMVASGQTPDPSVEETNTLLFNSVYIGLEHNVDELEPGALIAAIDEELNEDNELSSQSSWQSFKQPLPSPGRNNTRPIRRRHKGLKRSHGPSIEFRLCHLDAEFDQYYPDCSLVNRTLVTVEDVEILDHIKTSTWSKFLTSLRADWRGNVRESDSNMVRVELRTVQPDPGHSSQEARLRAKILPLRLHVDQDALDFLKAFFMFKDPDVSPPNSEQSEEIYLQQAEVFPIDIKLDYKPRRVDYRALREGRTIELMNFFHFDGAEMTLRHITLTGITGWPRFFDLLNDLWTPDVKATQLVDVISGVAPIRSVVNVGSGVADLVLLPIAQYKKDGRVVRGLQKGTTAFVKSTAMEAIKLGARLATGTQVILEQAENVLGGQFKDEITAEALQMAAGSDEHGARLDDDDELDLISKYADQPMNVKEGVQSAYKSLRKNFSSAAQTILAVPMEVYERSGNEGAVRAVVRAVPIAVLKPMIGASEAVSKTLLGLHNSMDPNIRQENEAKYKRR